MNTQFDELGFYDIYDVWHMPWWQTRAWYVCCIIIAVLVLLVGIFFLIKYIRRKKVEQPIWQQALCELEALRSGNYVTVARGKEFYFIITEILKKYMAVRYQLNTIGKTDSQFIEYLQKAKFSPELITEIETIFMGGLTIKFANAKAAQERIDQDFAGSVALIKKTIRQEKST
ncbi:DUF4381 family protein [Candidatus Dependentiae bacterium]|nr:DUF4381 family protein [Candidatus Dependentiae bacterium]